jgi:hypothetical protein
MERVLAAACLAEIERIWRASGDGVRPPSVWIAEHGPMASANDFPTAPVENAWLMDRYAISKRTAIDYVRFITVQSGVQWSTGMTALPAEGVFNDRPGRMHTIGVAAFAPILDSALVYLHYTWGGTFGRGSTYAFDPATAKLECVQDVWIS